MTSPLLRTRHRLMRQSKTRRMWLALLAMIGVLLVLPIVWHALGLKDHINVDVLVDYLRRFENSSMAFAWVIGMYALSAVILFPAVLISTAVIIVFAGVKGFIYCTVGAMVSSLVGYVIGRAVGRDRLERRFPAIRKLYHKMHAHGVLGVTVVRTIPMAPYAVISIIFGVIKTPLWMYLAGTFLGMLPGKVMLAIFGTSLRDFIENPSLIKIAQAGAFLLVWLVVIVACHIWARKWRHDHQQAEVALS